jgi:hypothetical protein
MNAKLIEEHANLIYSEIAVYLQGKHTQHDFRDFAHFLAYHTDFIIGIVLKHVKAKHCAGIDDHALMKLAADGQLTIHNGNEFYVLNNSLHKEILIKVTKLIRSKVL